MDPTSSALGRSWTNDSLDTDVSAEVPCERVPVTPVTGRSNLTEKKNVGPKGSSYLGLGLWD